MNRIKHAVGVLSLSGVALLVTAGSPFAADPAPYPVSPSPTTLVQAGGGDAAFTGSNVIPLLVVVSFLLVAGFAALFWARRISTR